MKSRVYIFLFLIALGACDGLLSGKWGKSATTFSLISAQQSGVDFVNQVDDLKDFNILNYRNFYNGGGVAIGDINNDGLEDLFFTSNQHANRLYLNKGNWLFEDITEQSGVAGTRKWSTGVTMVDINNDGFLDIYVCNSGELEGDDRKNELFINNGDLTFSEQAQKWGLDSDAFSVHATFFDYDLDGDLDCFLLNNSFRSPDRVEFYQKTRDEVGKEGGDRLLRNDGNFFTDVTLEAGIHTSDIGFGLGVSVSDFNNDMMPDMYISNDFWERDYLYINQGDGTFRDMIESKVSMTSMNSMGADVGDINNDTYPEILTTDMLPPDNYRIKTMTQFEPFRMGAVKFDTLYHHQIMQNCLQLNKDGLYFQEVAHQAGVASSDWSWGALILDMDMDGWKDIFIGNGIQRDITDFDFVDIITNKQVVDQIVSENKGFDFRDFLPFMPATKIPNSAFINQKNLTFKEQAHLLGLSEPSFSNGSAYGDLDNDGDLDLVINNANMPAFLYRNNTVDHGSNNFLKVQLKGTALNPLGIGAKVRVYSDGQVQELQHFLSRGFQSSVAPGLIFGMGKTTTADSVQIIWPDLSYAGSDQPEYQSNLSAQSCGCG
jgi:enediyne biosynthesis protein E4